VNIAPLVEDAVSLLRASTPAGVEFVTRIAPDLPHLSADATQLHQVIMNLGTNAAHALGPDGGTLTFVVEAVDLSAADLPSGAVRPGTFVRITVRDDGVGMASDVVDRIFEPFFTTKGVAGTGLGLSVVYGIVREHEGAIAVDSVPGEGTTFHVYLPAARESAGVAEPATHPLVRGAGERIMYVDDEESIVFVISRLLEELGYDVVPFTDPRLALAALRAEPAGFDVVITDFNMVGMTGSDFAAAAREIRAELPLVLVSGADTEHNDAHFAAVLAKPIRIEELSVLLHTLLDTATH
jgi:CheY-like chemotaxis protein